MIMPGLGNYHVLCFGHLRTQLSLIWSSILLIQRGSVWMAEVIYKLEHGSKLKVYQTISVSTDSAKQRTTKQQTLN